jgi:hypothetical protein
MSLPFRDLYEDCVGGENATAKELLQCITLKLNNDHVGAREFSQGVLLVHAAALVFFMQAGFAIYCKCPWMRPCHCWSLYLDRDRRTAKWMSGGSKLEYLSPYSIAINFRGNIRSL